MVDLFSSDSRKVAYVEWLKVKRRWSGGKSTPGMMIAMGPSDVTV